MTAIDALETPRLLVDEARMLANVARMRAHVRADALVMLAANRENAIVAAWPRLNGWKAGARDA